MDPGLVAGAGAVGGAVSASLQWASPIYQAGAVRFRRVGLACFVGAVGLAGAALGLSTAADALRPQFDALDAKVDAAASTVESTATRAWNNGITISQNGISINQPASVRNVGAPSTQSSPGLPLRRSPFGQATLGR